MRQKSLSKGGTRDALVHEIMDEMILAKVELAARGESQAHTQNNTFFFSESNTKANTYAHTGAAAKFVGGCHDSPLTMHTRTHTYTHVGVAADNHGRNDACKSGAGSER